MSDNNYIDPFTGEESAGERINDKELNVCISCEG
jgi:hypothetical protein